jgi:hypothetical protein
VFPSSAGARVEVNDGKVRVIDGPFAEAKELIGGFAILEVDSLAEAVEHARKFALLVGSERVEYVASLGRGPPYPGGSTAPVP